MPGPRMRFGAFIAPFHPLEENPTLAMARDMELVELLDRLGFDEAWIGEHHSAGFELIAAPDLFIAAAAERTRWIGTGVSSLPYHHPLMLANRITQLDHMTRGRVMFGVGPGALSSDAHMMGIPVAEQRDRMDEALAVLLPLLRGETVTRRTDWFALAEAHVQLGPYSRPSVEVAVASAVSPTGARAAGRHGIGLLSLGATSVASFNALAANWAIAEEMARASGTAMNRNAWRLTGPMHLAESREQALADIRFGIEKWVAYFRDAANIPILPAVPGKSEVEAYLEARSALIGTPDDAIERLRDLERISGGFGCFLLYAHNWADWAATRRSYELFARYVMPALQGLNVGRQASYDWAARNKQTFSAEHQAATRARIAAHIAEKGADNIRPETAALLKGEKR